MCLSIQIYPKFTYFHTVKSYYLILLLILGACSLSPDQETSLNKAMTMYINARNEGGVTAYVAYTHPAAVAHYTALGDSVFKSRYDLSAVNDNPFLKDGTILEIESEGSRLHIKYSFVSLAPLYSDERSKEVYLFAISENNGESWFFIDEEDYFDTDIIKEKDRLIK